ncbi:MAG: cis-2,3-dihydrobiphenyl-2,3-diol dehydrogenase [Limisphaerales bacterium]|jgi:cis-2,3-dihydrobiphenyl-2,3-diol dehydrogenase
MRLTNQKVLITGSGSGLGLAVAERFVSEGAQVLLVDRSQDRLAAAGEHLGAAVRTYVGDVRSMQSMQGAVDFALAEFGALDCVIGNAGIWDYSKKLDDTPAESLEDAFDELFHINVLGYITLAKAAIPALVRSQGSIIYTVSSAGFDAGGGGVLYTASKHAVVGLITQLAHELAPVVRVNGVAPGPINTQLTGPESMAMSERSIADLNLPENVGQDLAIGRVPATSEYAGAFVHLASRADAAPTTGTVLKADCGIGVRGMTRPALGQKLVEKYGTS